MNCVFEIEQNIARIDFNKGILLQKFHIAFLSFSLAPHCGIKGGADFILLPRLVRDLPEMEKRNKIAQTQVLDLRNSTKNA